MLHVIHKSELILCLNLVGQFKERQVAMDLNSRCLMQSNAVYVRELPTRHDSATFQMSN